MGERVRRCHSDRAGPPPQSYGAGGMEHETDSIAQRHCHCAQSRECNSTSTFRIAITFFLSKHRHPVATYHPLWIGGETADPLPKLRPLAVLHQMGQGGNKCHGAFYLYLLSTYHSCTCHEHQLYPTWQNQPSTHKFYHSTPLTRQT